MSQEAHEIIEWYLTYTDGGLIRYHRSLNSGQRIGQAFFNALSPEDQESIRGTIWDTFHNNEAWEVASTISMFLTRKH